MAEISSEASKKLEALATGIQTFSFAEKVWSRMLTPEERELLGGDLEAAWKDNDLTLGMVSYVWQCSPAQALMRICKEFGVLAPADFHWLCQELGISDLTDADAETQTRPIWKKTLSELHFRGEVVRTFRSITVAKYSVGILDAFQQANWSPRIESPLSCDAQDLRDAVRSLNEGLKILRFEMDGTGKGLRWKVSTSHAPPAHDP